MSWRDRVKSGVRRPATRVAASLPLGRGSLRLQQFVEQAQVTEARRLIARRKYDKAQALLGPHVDRAVSSRDALAALALLHKRAGTSSGEDPDSSFEERLERYGAAVSHH